MIYKVALFSAFLTVAKTSYSSASVFPHASYSYAPAKAVVAPAVVTHSANILRSQENSAQVSAFSKTIKTPHSNVYNSDVRVSNDALSYPYAHGHMARFAYAHGHMARFAYAHAYASPTYGNPYAAPAYPQGYVTPAYFTQDYGAPESGGHFGVAYSSAPAVTHFLYSNGYSLHYSY